jgi:hypothetical protein
MILSWMNFSLPLVPFPNSTFLINVAQHSRPVGKYPGSGSDKPSDSVSVPRGSPYAPPQLQSSLPPEMQPNAPVTSPATPPLTAL